MAIRSNKLIPVLAAAGLLIAGVALYKQFSGGAVRPGADLKAVPKAQAPAADADSPAETLRTVIATNKELRGDIDKVIQRNNALVEENNRLKRQPPAPAPTPAPAPAAAPASAAQDKSALDNAIDSAARAADTFSQLLPLPGAAPAAAQAPARPAPAARPGGAGAMTGSEDGAAPGDVRYVVLAPMGYAAQTDARGGARGAAMTRYVRTMQSETSAGADHGPATQAAARAAARQAATPYFTLPENATLAGVTAMTSIIGRVPIDGRVTDPMQFKAIVGRDNLAANGFELPGDVAGMIVTGIAIGDMALSCNEGKVRSVTFVFNDGTIRTVSSRNRGGNTVNRNGGGSSGDLGFISDLHGNPCIAGRFITNAGAFLADIIAVKGLSAAGQAYSAAQTMTSQSAANGITSSVTGNVGSYAMGQAVAGAGDEITKWLLAREKNSFDAVVTPSGQQLVVHLDQEIDIDKTPNARKLVHRQQEAVSAYGERYGLQ